MSWCFAEERTDSTDQLLGRLGAESALVPGLWILEVANVLLVAERRGRITAARSAQFLSVLQSLSIVVANTELVLAADLISLAREHSLSAYDSAYVALALRAGLPIATRDRDVAAAAAVLGIPVL